MALYFNVIVPFIGVLLSLSSALPSPSNTSNCTNGIATPQCCPACFGTLPSIYTLTAIKAGLDQPENHIYNGLKVQTFNLFQANVSSYCPFTGDEASFCPNGTDMALVGDLYPLCEVPGGQMMYVNSDGLISITVQHSASFPPGSYPYYEGWAWTPYPIWRLPDLLCPKDNLEYNCDPPTGFWNFKLPNATVGGLQACPNEYNPSSTSVYAVTPEFNRTGCVKLDGLGTHNYTGPNPPVWAYY